MIPSKRSSLASHHASMPSIEIQSALDSERMQKYIQFIRISIRNHLKEKQYSFQQTELKEIHKLIKTIQQNYIKSQKDNQLLLANLRNQNDELTLERQQTILKLKASLSEQMQQKISQFNQRIMSLNNEYGRKEQAYKETIQQLLNGLSNAQNNHQQVQNKLNQQLLSVTKVLNNLITARKRQQYIRISIKDIVEQIALRQENSQISSKSDQLSLDQIVLPHQNSAIQANQSAIIMDDFPETSLDKQLQNWLIKLVCFGLFQKTNEECIRKMIAFTANYEQPTELLDEKVFPVMLEVLTSNMRKHQEQAHRYLQGSPGLCEGDEGSRVELRNINNLSELSINTLSEMSIIENQVDDLNFRKSKHF